MKWEIQTKGRTYIRRKENKQTLERKLKLRRLVLEIAEQTENNVGHNTPPLLDQSTICPKNRIQA